jgi:hypothetical protein
MGGKDCPEGFDCVTADRGDGKGFCRPTGGAPCPCTPKFQDQGFTTDCFVSNDFGTCKASRTCDQTCPAATPASESCNGVDDDCDGTIDPEASAGCLVFFEDQDNDGHGKPGSARCLCAPEGPYRAAIGDDCDDGQTGVNPDATESCNGKDDDCDGVTDEESSSGCTEYYRDEDKDGFGTAGNPACRCLPGDGYTATQAGDCDDQDPTRNPGQPESCNGADDDCDGLTDEPDATGCELFYADQDQDGFGDPGDGLCLCAATLDHATRNKADCNDQDGDIHPGVVESCNGLDDDCDGTADPAGTQGCVSYCVDADGDGYGVTTQVACLCKPDAVHSVKLPGDCDDANVLINPGVAEDCATPADDDCDGSSNEPDAAHCLAFFWDADGDGWGTDEARCLCAASGAYRAEKSGDCDDTNAKANPGVQEDCATAFDDDCDGKSGEEGALGCVDYFEDADRDGFGSPGGLPRCLCGPMEPYLAVTPGDCDDSAPQINPGQAETCGNLTDDDCDGETDEAGATGCVEMFRDEDGDGYGVAGDAKCLCKPSAPYTAPEPGDCRDQDPAVNPRQAEVCGDSLDNDCDAKTDEEGASGCVVYYKDLDGDGSGVTADSRCLCSPTSGYTSAKPGDCNDMDPEIRPGKVELCGDKKDNDCNGATDEEGATGCKTYRRDADKDGFGVKEDTKCLCEPWTPYTVMDLPLIASDCDDSNKALNPGPDFESETPFWAHFQAPLVGYH